MGLNQLRIAPSSPRGCAMRACVHARLHCQRNAGIRDGHSPRCTTITGPLPPLAPLWPLLRCPATWQPAARRASLGARLPLCLPRPPPRPQTRARGERTGCTIVASLAGTRWHTTGHLAAPRPAGLHTQHAA